MHHDHLYKVIYLHCTKHCIHNHPFTKPSSPTKTNAKQSLSFVLPPQAADFSLLSLQNRHFFFSSVLIPFDFQTDSY